MDVWEAISKIDFSTAGLSLLVWVMVLGAGAFIWKRLWPWFEKDYFPARVRREQEKLAAHTAAENQRNGLLVSIRDAMIELRVISGQQLLLLQNQDKKLDDLSLKTAREYNELMTRLSREPALAVNPAVIATTAPMPTGGV